MAGPSDHTYSFGNITKDDTFMNSHPQGQVQSGYHSHLHQSSTASRDMQSPFPSYPIPPPREYDISPPSPPVHRSHPSLYPTIPQSTDLSDTPIQASSVEYSRAVPSRHVQDGGNRTRDLGYSTSTRTASTTTPDIDNMGESAAGGGIAGIAMGVANTNERESGVEALRSLDENPQNHLGLPPERAYNTIGSDTPYVPSTPSAFRGLHRQDPYASPAPSATNPFDDENRQISANPSPAQLTPRGYQSQTSIPMQEYPSLEDVNGGHSSYSDNPYNRFSTAWDPRVGHGEIDPNDIEDDGDDGMMPPPSRRRSALGLKAQPDPTLSAGDSAGGTAQGAARGGVLGALGGLVGRKNAVGEGGRDPSGQYGPVPATAFDDGGIEKSDWLKRQTSGRSKLRWIVGIVLVILIIGGIVGGAIGGIRSAKNNKSDDTLEGSSGESASEDDGNGDLDKNSEEIKKLMGNPDLRKVFPGMDYTPFNAQYPACLSNPPSQNNVTRDMAVLSQLTNAVRLYGTDCNQTEMVLHAIDKLALTDMKVWLGIWLASNTTTNDRGMKAMYDILNKYGADPFLGVIIGNEVLYREDLTEVELGKVLADVKQNFTSLKINLPVATSDLGDNWKPPLVEAVDIVMSNVHPFFAGQEVDVAAAWTWNFWTQHDISLTTGSSKKNIVSEVGWPSAGGRHCGAVNCTDAIKSSAVAGIDEMNQFMGDWVCQSLTNGTEYFWYVMLYLLELSRGVELILQRHC